MIFVKFFFFFYYYWCKWGLKASNVLTVLTYEVQLVKEVQYHVQICLKCLDTRQMMGKIWRKIVYSRVDSWINLTLELENRTENKWIWVVWRVLHGLLMEERSMYWEFRRAIQCSNDKRGREKEMCNFIIDCIESRKREEFIRRKAFVFPLYPGVLWMLCHFTRGSCRTCLPNPISLRWCS